MRSTLSLALAAVTFASASIAQSPAPPQAPASQPTEHIQANTELVVVDVVVQDKAGNPVHGLKAENFHLSEGKTPQTLRHFEEHSAGSPAAPGPTLPRMPPGTFTDYTPIAPNGTLNILLLDALNTPTKDQAYVRQQLQQYVSKADPGTRIAIFGLANRLILLQGFTSDPKTLKDVVDKKLIARSSSLLDDPTGSGVDQLQMSDVAAENGLASAEQIANLEQFEAETRSLETQLRVQYTLDAFNSLAHYLSAFPGRKNLIWFSGSFPINILPDPSIQNPFAVMHTNADEARETTSLLSKAQVSVYPIDARGLMVDPTFNAANSGRALSRNPNAFNQSNVRFFNSQAVEHGTMDTLAEDTGGHAFYNTNGIADAVQKAINSGANYYSLAYSPSDRRQDGTFRSIHVDVSGTPNVQLSYRRGYYTDDDTHKKKVADPTTDEAKAANGSIAAYQRAVMSRGAPTPQDLLFKVRVLPTSTATETTVAPDNSLDPKVSAAGPFRRYAVDYVALPNEFQLTQQLNGRRSGKVSFIVYVFDTDGRLLNATGKTVSLNLTPDVYAKFQHSAMQAHLEVSVPTRIETFLRIGVQDVSANRYGVVEIPVSTVSRLPPATYAAAPAPAPPATTPASPAARPAPPENPTAPPATGTAPTTPSNPAPSTPAPSTQPQPPSTPQR